MRRKQPTRGRNRLALSEQGGSGRAAFFSQRKCWLFESRFQNYDTFVRVSAIEMLMRIRMQLLGKVTRALGFAIEPTILKATKQFFRDFCWECDQAARKAQGKS